MGWIDKVVDFGGKVVGGLTSGITTGITGGVSAGVANLIGQKLSPGDTYAATSAPLSSVYASKIADREIGASGRLTAEINRQNLRAQTREAEKERLHELIMQERNIAGQMNLQAMSNAKDATQRTREAVELQALMDQYQDRNQPFWQSIQEFFRGDPQIREQPPPPRKAYTPPRGGRVRRGRNR